jgi:hypothetical protein
MKQFIAKALLVPVRHMRSIIVRLFGRNGIVLISVASKCPALFRLIRKIRKETDSLVSDLDACQIYKAVKKTEKIEGDIAEVGVYRGSSAKIICETSKKPVHLFDTFEGLPAISRHDDAASFHKGDFPASLENVKNYLKSYTNAFFYKGLFPDTVESVKDKKFSFVHLDVDIYQSTLDGLNFFYPRMNKGAIMISHDYPSSPGVKKAFDEFFERKPETIIELLGSGQCLVVKVS